MSQISLLLNHFSGPIRQELYRFKIYILHWVLPNLSSLHPQRRLALDKNFYFRSFTDRIREFHSAVGPLIQNFAAQYNAVNSEFWTFLNGVHILHVPESYAQYQNRVMEHEAHRG
jgi:hypothetical protein